MLLVAPDPALGIAPERTSRVRALLDASGTAPGVAVALPGGAAGVLDALVLRPDGVLGLLPVGAAVPVPAGAGTGAGEDDAAAEIDRLLGLVRPAPTAPRQVVPYPEGSDGAARAAARLVLTARPATRVLGAAEVRAVFAALRLADHAPDAAALSEAGFGSDENAGATTPVAGSGDDHEPVVPTARSATSSNPASSGVAPRATSSNPTSSGVAPRATSSHPSNPLPEPAEPEVPETSPLRRLPATGLLPSTPEAPRSRRSAPRRGLTPPAWFWTWRGLALAAVAVFLLALGAAALVSQGAAPTSGGPATTDQAVTRTVGGLAFTRRVATSDPTCEGHAYGQAAQFLRARPCQGLDRSLWTTDVAGAPMVVSVAAVRMGDASSASAFKSLVDSSNTGNVSDLLREGRGYPGGPAGLSDAGYASRLSGDGLVIVETDRADGGSADAGALDRLARQALALAP